jgi:hypothetical protein
MKSVNRWNSVRLSGMAQDDTRLGCAMPG